MANSYPVGDVVHITASFTSGGGAADPTTITLFLKGPNVNTQYTYAGGTVTRDSLGNYHVDYTTPASGSYYYRWEGTGAVIAAIEGTFTAGPSYFK